MAKRNKKKKHEAVNVLIIPGPSAEAKNLRLSRPTIVRTAIIASAFMIGVLILGWAYLSGLDMVRNVDLIRQESRAKDQKIEELNAEMESIQKQQEQIEKKQLEIKKLMGIKADQQSQIQPSRGGQGGEDGDASKENRGTRAMEYDLAAYEQELDEMIAKVKDDQKYFRAVPNQWPAQGEISSDYGLRKSPFSRNKSFHDGLDIANNLGTDIVAAGDGLVIFSGYMPVYGRTIVIKHGYGFETKYGHNSSLLVKEGDRVKKGDLIAKMGNTGRSTGPHMHFSVYKNGQLQDPKIYLP